jgi:hypothetical protein
LASGSDCAIIGSTKEITMVIRKDSLPEFPQAQKEAVERAEQAIDRGLTLHACRGRPCQLPIPPGVGGSLEFLLNKYRAAGWMVKVHHATDQRDDSYIVFC